jgi:hypothetical protein
MVRWVRPPRRDALPEVRAQRRAVSETRYHPYVFGRMQNGVGLCENCDEVEANRMHRLHRPSFGHDTAEELREKLRKLRRLAVAVHDASCDLQSVAYYDAVAALQCAAIDAVDGPPGGDA